MHVFKRGIVANGARGLDAVHTRHPNVHEHHVGMQPRRQFHRFMAIARLAYHVDAVVRHQYELETAADEILIVRHQHLHALFHLRLRSLHRQAGNHAEAAAGSIARRNVPPNRCTRSAMPAMPCPSPSTAWGSAPDAAADAESPHPTPSSSTTKRARPSSTARRMSAL